MPEAIENTFPRSPFKRLLGLEGVLLFLRSVSDAAIAQLISTPKGTFYAENLLLWRDMAGTGVGQVQFFICVTLGGAQEGSCFAAFVLQYSWVARAIYSTTTVQPMLVDARFFCKALPHQRLDGKVHVYLPVVS